MFNQKLSWKICRFFFQKGKRKKLFTLLSYVEQLPINYPFMIYCIRDSKKRMQYIDKFFKLENKVLNEKIIHFFFFFTYIRNNIHSWRLRDKYLNLISTRSSMKESYCIVSTYFSTFKFFQLFDINLKKTRPFFISPSFSQQLSLNFLPSFLSTRSILVDHLVHAKEALKRLPTISCITIMTQHVRRNER